MDLHHQRDREHPRAAARDHQDARTLPKRLCGHQTDLAGAAQLVRHRLRRALHPDGRGAWRYRLAHRVGRSSQATLADVEVSEASHTETQAAQLECSSLRPPHAAKAAQPRPRCTPSTCSAGQNDIRSYLPSNAAHTSCLVGLRDPLEAEARVAVVGNHHLSGDGRRPTLLPAPSPRRATPRPQPTVLGSRPTAAPAAHRGSKGSPRKRCPSRGRR